MVPSEWYIAWTTSPGIGLERLSTRVSGFSTSIVEIAVNVVSRGLFRLYSRLALMALASTGSPLENLTPGRMWRVTVVGVVDQLSMTFGVKAVLVMPRPEA